MNNIPAFIQGVTEFLPVSSSLHLEIWAFLNGLNWTKDHEVSLHLGTLISLCLYFVVPRHFPSFRTILYLIVATLPCVVIGFMIKRSGWSAPHVWLFYSSILGGCGLLLGEFVAKRQNLSASIRQRTSGNINLVKALCVGLAQVLAFVPGASRMGTTITMARLLGVSPKEAIHFSWMLAIPTVGGAVSLSAMDAWKTGSVLPLNIHQIIVTAVIGLGVMLVLGKHADSGFLRLCGYYRILLGIILLILNGIGCF